jgi:hypothetical protein
VKRHDRELDRDVRPVLAQGWNSENVTGAITGPAGAHSPVVTLPVAPSQAFRNDDIERSSQGLRFRITEDAPGAFVPEDDRALCIRIGDSIRSLQRERPAEAIKVKAHEPAPLG